jgi:hypothetical protein
MRDLATLSKIGLDLSRCVRQQQPTEWLLHYTQLGPWLDEVGSDVA